MSKKDEIFEKISCARERILWGTGSEEGSLQDALLAEHNFSRIHALYELMEETEFEKTFEYVLRLGEEEIICLLTNHRLVFPERKETEDAENIQTAHEDADGTRRVPGGFPSGIQY